MSRTVAITYAAAAALTATALGWTLWQGLRQPAIALAFGLLIAVGETVRGALPGDRESAPLGAAGALAYALLGEAGGEPTSHGVLQVIAVTVAASLVGLAPQVAVGRAPSLDQAARRVLTVGFAATCFQPLYTTGTLAQWLGTGPYHVVVLLLILLLTVLCDAVLTAALARARTGWPYGPLLRDELRALLGIGTAICATSVVIALAVAVAGLWALPVFCVPLLLTQLSFRRYAASQATYRQTIASLARATEVAGYTPHGHARRVAELSRATGRELGLSEAELTVLEYAALMHDIGQLSLLDPVPGGATEPLDPAEQRRIALLGGAVVRQTGVPAEVAVIVERQADPYREQPLTARIVRTVNAYEDLVRAAPGKAPTEPVECPLQALEQLRLATAYDHDPRVVEALAQVVSRGPAG
ncbi:HD-GYP domain-containing protein [Streptomyces gobiensis]|uniref:HD-GYP domain-containing protein n=1 Tax=Streptomyces gobiensis TaxID=2875706 RepID=UPI001E621E0A|nr:HD domain-containing protein [Streptomyces gobiensis]UGY93547.1 HD domain-containing protein [Streptomyces gobiensis]